MENIHSSEQTIGTRKLVKIVIPIYRSKLQENERLSLQNNVAVLARYPIILLAPDGLDITETEQIVKDADVMRVSSDWLGEQCGIEGYNRMMLSADFYNKFSDYTYILICQIDAWIFRDELAEWCQKGYDYIGAPWIKRPRYGYFPLNIFFTIRKFSHMLFQRLISNDKFTAPTRYERFGRVGNGGLSLRKIESFVRICYSYTAEIEFFNMHSQMTCNEDWFWGLIPAEISRPTALEALRFSIDDHPARCLELNRGELPFGCHGWTKRRNIDFWQKIIAADRVAKAVD